MQGIKDALKDVGAEHRWCVRHLYANLKLEHKGKALKDALCNCAIATTKSAFDKEMKELERIDKDAIKWVKKRDPKHWSKHAFSTKAKSDMLLNNIAETFNSFILEARDKPILTMLEMIRRLLMKRYVAKKEGMSKYNGPICPRIQTKIERAKKGVIYCFPYMVGDGKFEVDQINVGRWVVDPNKRSCDCYQWDLTGIPCTHAVACMNVIKVRPEFYVDDYYKKEAFMATYSHLMNPVPGEQSWP